MLMENTIFNMKRAIQESNPELTMAVLVNLLDVLPSYIEGLNQEMHDARANNQIIKRSKPIKLKGKTV